MNTNWPINEHQSAEIGKTKPQPLPKAAMNAEDLKVNQCSFRGGLEEAKWEEIPEAPAPTEIYSGINSPRSAASAEAACPGSESAGVQSPPRRRLTFYHPDDREHLTELMCIVRKQLEVFVENNSRGGKRDAPTWNDQTYAGGKVGVRCIYCAPPLDSGDCRTSSPSQKPMRGAVLYPTSIRLVHQSVRNYQRFHMLKCPAMPHEVRDRIVSLKSALWRKRSVGKAGLYWEMSCARLGLVDTPGGLRLRKAALEGTWTKEMGSRAVADTRAGENLAGSKAKTHANRGVVEEGSGCAEKVISETKPLDELVRLPNRGSKRTNDVVDAGDTNANVSCANNPPLSTMGAECVSMSLALAACPPLDRESEGGTCQTEGNRNWDQAGFIPMGENEESITNSCSSPLLDPVSEDAVESNDFDELFEFDASGILDPLPLPIGEADGANGSGHVASVEQKKHTYWRV